MRKWYKQAQGETLADIPEWYQQTIDMLNESADKVGLKVYAVGGFVRDLLLGRTPKDLDVMVDVVDTKKYLESLRPIHQGLLEDPVSFVQSQMTGAKEVTDVEEVDIDQSNHRPEFFRITGKIDYIDRSGKNPQKVNGELFESTINPSMIFAKQFVEDFPEMKTVPRGEAFGIYALQTPVGEVEAAYPRTETYEGDSRKPRTEMGTVQEDANRRDFGMNALFLDLDTNQIIDETGHGLQDIKDRTIRISDPESIDIIFKDDPLRILRAIRQAAQLGFQIDPQILEYVRTNPHLMAMKEDSVVWDEEDFEPKLSSERIAEEMKKIMSLPGAYRSISLMKDLDILTHVLPLPEEAEAWELDQINPHHDENVWNHTVSVMREMDNFLQEEGVNDPAKLFQLNFAALLHDTGKLVPERGFQDKVKDEHGNITRRTFKGHPDVSTEIAENTLRRLRYPNKAVDSITKLVQHHDAALDFQNPETIDYNMMKLIKEIGPLADDLLYLAVGDRRAHAEGSNDSSYLEQVLAELPEKYKDYEARTRSFIKGGDIMSLIGGKGGPWISQIMSHLEEMQMKGLVNSPEEAAGLIQKLAWVSEISGRPVEGSWAPGVMSRLISAPDTREGMVEWMSANMNSLKYEGNNPLVASLVGGNEIKSMFMELGIELQDPRMIGQIKSEAIQAQLRGEIDDANWREWLAQRVESERPQDPEYFEEPEISGEDNMREASKNAKMVFSERNLGYFSPMPLREDRVDDAIDLIISEHERFLSGSSDGVDWGRIGAVLNDDDFLKEIIADSEADPEKIYRIYSDIRDENIKEYLGEILASSEEDLYGLDVSEVKKVFDDDIARMAILLVEKSSFGPDHFSELKEVEIQQGDFIGVFDPDDETKMAVNPPRLEEEAERMMKSLGLTEEIDKKHIMSLILGEALVHEATHSQGDNNDGVDIFPGEKAADINSRRFLDEAIDAINFIRRESGLDPFDIEEDREGKPLEDEKKCL